MRGNAGEKERELLSPSFAGITLIRFYGYDLSPALASGHPGNFIATKLGKKVLKSVTFQTPLFVLQQIQLL